MRSPEELIALAESAVKRALASGADAAEAFVTEGEQTRIEALGRYASPREARDDGVAIRVIVEGRLGLAGATSVAKVDDAVRNAIQAARSVPAVSRVRAFAPRIERALRPPAPRDAPSDVALLSEIVFTANDALLSTPHITYAGTTASALRKRLAVATSDGLAVWDESASERINVEIRAQRGTTARTANESFATPRTLASELDIRALVADCAKRAVDALDPRPLEGPPVEDILLAPAGVAQMVRVFTEGLSGRRALTGKTPLAGRLGERVVSERVTIRDAPSGPEGLRHRRIDDEGTPTVDRALVEAGVLRGFLHDSASARESGADPTGNGLRKSVQGGVLIGPVNLVMDAGDSSLSRMVEGAQRAVLVNEALMGSFTSNDVTGDFSLVAPFAFLVENGRVSHALPPTTVGGNVHRLLQNVRDVGSERRVFQAGTFPSLRSGGVSCAT